MVCIEVRKFNWSTRLLRSTMCRSKLIAFNSEENDLHCPEAVFPDAEERPTEVICPQVSLDPPAAVTNLYHFQVLCPDGMG